MEESILEQSKKARSNGIVNFFKKINKKQIIVLGIFILILFTSWFFFVKDKGVKKVVAVNKEWIVKKDDLKISIESDGKVVAEDGVELSFSVSGNNLEVKEVFVKEGDKIKKGDKIATVKTETLELNVRSSYSSYLSALADYNETLDGATDDEIASAKDKITSAEISLEQTKMSLESTKQSAEKSIYDAEQAVKDAKEELDDNRDELSSEDVSNAYENLVDTIKSTNISLDGILKNSDEIIGVDDKSLNDDFEYALGLESPSTLTQAEEWYINSRNELGKLNSLAVSLSLGSSYSEVDKSANQTTITLQEFEKHLYYMKLMLETTITSGDLTQASLDSFMSTISSNRTSINTKITAINTKIKAVNDAKDLLDDYVDNYNDAKIDLENEKLDAERSVENAESNVRAKELSLEQTKRDYDDLLAPLTDAESASARSKLTSSSISLQKSQNELKNATIISPIDGEVARLNYKKGDIIVDNSSSDPVAVILNSDTLFIEVNIEEADINKINVGQKAYATFDAVGSLELEGEISFISLTSSTNNSGIVTYLVRIVIMNKGENKIREGMTAFVDFITAEAKDVLVIPVSAVSNVNNKPSVLNKNEEWVPVVTGFTDGKNVEVISGLNAGDIIIY